METTLSQKKEDLLYDSVHNEIIDARIKIIMFLKKNKLPWEEIDCILYELSVSAPEESIKCFQKKLKIK